ncbi:hypothetical protein [Methanobrevibacter millerae]|uniref:Uncharacterized protein n=1 Tax=Methanobrevibacter millerae TaxID=230361 RepID=A0A1G5UWY3_9EURY|nr:hypothetical protein [Methanobrevibacter millerae]SDA37537.1 hypothetical protein SAMN02910315_00134 [Methanobrevibacter millerae]
MIILCSYAFATSNIDQEKTAVNAINSTDIAQEDATINEINNQIIKNSADTIYVEYDENDDSVMTLYGGYSTTSSGYSDSSKDSSIDLNEHVQDSTPAEDNKYPIGTIGSCANAA